MMGVEGEKGLNVISTSHDEGTDEAGRFLLENKFMKGYTIREHIHNHPKGTTIPSGITDWTHPKTGVFYPAGTYGDIGVSRWIYDYTHNKNTKFFIYTRINGYNPYSHKQ